MEKNKSIHIAVLIVPLLLLGCARSENKAWPNVILTSGVFAEEGSEYISIYNPNSREAALTGEYPASNISILKDDKLVGRFLAGEEVLATYDLKNHELQIIEHLDVIRKQLESTEDWERYPAEELTVKGPVQMSEDETRVYFILGYTLCQYNVGEKRVSVIDRLYSETVLLREAKNELLYLKSGDLIAYNLMDATQQKYNINAQKFTAGLDGDDIYYLEKDSESINYFSRSQNKIRKLFQLNQSHTEMHMSSDGSCLLYSKRKGSLVDSTGDREVYLYRISSGSRIKVFDSKTDGNKWRYVTVE